LPSKQKVKSSSLFWDAKKNINMNTEKMTAITLSIFVICVAACIITGIIIGGRYCNDSVHNISDAPSTVNDCAHGAKAELQKIDGKNMLLCHCPESK
jgi:hypothetical protein